MAKKTTKKTYTRKYSKKVSKPKMTQKKKELMMAKKFHQFLMSRDQEE